MMKSTRKHGTVKLQIVDKKLWAALQAQPLLQANPQSALPLLSMIGRAQLSIEDMPGQMSRQFVEPLLVMAQALKGDADEGVRKLKAHAVHLKPKYPDAAASLLERLEEMFTINKLGVTGELARCLATTNIIESPNSAVRRVSGRVTRYRDVSMAMRWVAAGFLEAERSFKRLRGHKQIAALVRAMRPESVLSKKAA